jgi:hypothetical protein
MGSMGCPETSVSNYHSSLRNIPEDWRPPLQFCVSLKSRLEENSNYDYKDILFGVASVDWR